MVERGSRPSAISPTASGPSPIVDADNTKVTARLPTGESVEIYLHGATVTSWRNANGTENMWVSSNAKLDGSKPIRGGIPLIFPNFGPPVPNHATSNLPQHGFARISPWEYLGKSSSESSTTESKSTSKKSAGEGAVRLDFGLSPSNVEDKYRKAWPYEFALQYSVTLSQEGLKTMLEVRNPGKEKWEFQTLVGHTYFKIPDINKVTVTGLAGVRYTDKVLNGTEHDSQGNELKIQSTVDRVYRDLKQDTTSILIDGKPGIDVVRDNLNDVVVWNPWKEVAAGIADFEPKDGYKNMLCVEAGSVSGWNTLDAEDGWEAGQMLKSYL